MEQATDIADTQHFPLLYHITKLQDHSAPTPNDRWPWLSRAASSLKCLILTWPVLDHNIHGASALKQDENPCNDMTKLDAPFQSPRIHRAACPGIAQLHPTTSSY